MTHSRMFYRRGTAKNLAIIFGVLLTLLSPYARPVHAQGSVDIVLTGAPASTINVNDSFTITVEVQAGAQQVSVAEVHLNFDPTVLRVDAVTPGGTMEVVLDAATFDNGAGTIDYAAGSLTSLPSGTFALLTIDFTAVAPGTSTIEDAAGFPRQTIAAFDGSDVLGTATSVDVQVNTTLAVSLNWFLAEPAGEIVEFQWETATENGVAGFHLFAQDADGNIEGINESLIPSTSIDSVTPTRYQFAAETDATIFLLQELSINGSVVQYGPFELAAPDQPTDPDVEEQTPKIWLPLLMQ